MKDISFFHPIRIEASTHHLPVEFCCLPTAGIISHHRAAPIYKSLPILAPFQQDTGRKTPEPLESDNEMPMLLVQIFYSSSNHKMIVHIKSELKNSI